MDYLQPYNKDRTHEFQSICQTLDNSSSPSSSSSSSSSSSLPLQFDFGNQATKICSNIRLTSQKLVKLSKLVNWSLSVFDDLTCEIQELTALIKQDITALNSAAADLQSLCNIQKGSWNVSAAASNHYAKVIDNLKNRLKVLEKEFKEVLTPRTKMLKDRETRTRHSGASTESTNPFVRRHPFANKKQAEGESEALLQQQEQWLHEINQRFILLGNMRPEDLERHYANVVAQDQLVRYRTSLSPTGWLTIKILFVVMMVYWIIFLVFIK